MRSFMGKKTVKLLPGLQLIIKTDHFVITNCGPEMWMSWKSEIWPIFRSSTITHKFSMVNGNPPVEQGHLLWGRCWRCYPSHLKIFRVSRLGCGWSHRWGWSHFQVQPGPTHMYQDDDDKTSGMILMINTNFCTVVKWRRSKIGKSGSRNVLG